ncbi:hypothetical protein GYA93_21220 [Gordonia desulfuricans]|uniref:Uncharacterized protein n=1 Tax=Gordonia desulfuricans TaxID=89051 RepID=A0A7K3LVV1_9ACTN|nr:hypothetical protein [Gordonia desulfuricans]NDK92071.1 hypothetical protein [Gordonia desulfuricans]
MSDLAFPGVFDGFFDDAAVFPPGRAPLDRAVRDHVSRLDTPIGRAVGPLLLPVAALDDAASIVAGAGGDPVGVGVVVAAGGLDDALAAAARVEPWLRVTGLELKTDGVDPRPVIDAGAALTDRVELAIEQIRNGALDHLDGTDIGLKARTGGLVAEAFPTVDDVADVLTVAAAARRPFKLTAGLHRAVRYVDESTGFAHHGFLNIAVATDAAIAGADTSAVAQILAGSDGNVLAQRFREIGGGWRALFESFGTCSIAEPLETLADLDLIPTAFSGHRARP